jgi:hypothetical protein
MLLRLMNARTSAAVDDVIAALPVVSPDQYQWVTNTERQGTWQEGKLHWVPVGLNRGNGANIKLAGEPFNPIAERVVNGMEALIELHRLLELLEDPNAPEPISPRAAVERYFGLPKLDEIERMPEPSRSQLRSLVSEVQKKLKLMLDYDPGSSEFAVTIRDLGMGQTPERMKSTLLSLTQSDKPDKKYLIGLFGQGGSSAYHASDYSVIISRRAPQLRQAAEDERIGWTIVRQMFQEGRRDTYWAYLASSKDGSVPSFGAAAADVASFHQGSHLCHIGYGFGGAKSAVSRQIYQAMNHLLFNPILPYELYAMKEKPDAMRGTAQRLALRVRDENKQKKSSLSKSFPQLNVTLA